MKKTMKHTILLALFLIHIIFATPLALAEPIQIPLKEKGVLSVCAYSEFKPISYGHGQGYEADLLKAITKLWQLKIKFYSEATYQDLWLLPSKQNSPCDIAIGGMTPSNDRIKEGALFSITTATFDQSLLIRKKDYLSGAIISYASFKNSDKKIGVVPGTTGEQYAHVLAKENKLPPSVFIQYASESALLPALKSGKIDAIARGNIGNDYQASIDENLMTIAHHNFNEGFAFAVNATNGKLQTKLNEAIAKMTQHGKISYSQWLKNHAIFMKQVEEN